MRIKRILFCALFMALGLLIFKYLPMKIWGGDIQFDASQHLIITFFILFLLWNLIERNNSLKTPFFIISFFIIVFVGLQRIKAEAHDVTGLTTGLLISIISILAAKFLSKKSKSPSFPSRTEVRGLLDSSKTSVFDCHQECKCQHS